MPKQRRPHPRSSRRRRQPKEGMGFFGFAVRALVLLALGVGLAVGLYGVHLDKVVRAKFEGKRWALPARVYARPLEIYTGRSLSVAELEGELGRLGYREDAQLARPGSYHIDGEQAAIRTRPFRYWDGYEPERYLSVDLAGGVVKAVADGNDATPLALVRLDPALIASIYPTHNEDRVLLRREQLPSRLVKTLLAVEDRQFYQHHGVDPKGILRAAYENLRAGRTVQGASTLTQQLVKNFYLTQERTLERKLNEAYMAVLLDWRYDKDEILTAYANEVYLGQDGSRAIHGFGLASRFYFDRDIDELDIPQTAMLVAILKGPSDFNPQRNPERVRERRNLVIDLMAHHQIISKADAEQAKQAPLGVVEGGARPSGEYPGFIQLVRRQLRRDYREEDLRSEGLRIFTTLDPLTQAHVEAAVKARLPKLDRSRRLPEGTLETAAVVTSVAQGEVLAVVGGRDPGYAGFNRALDAVRPIGSLIKPVIYLKALSQPQRYSLVTPIQDKPVNLRVAGVMWRPKNYDHSVHGTVPLYRGLVKSYNLATVNLGLDLGVDQVAGLLRDLGAVRDIDAVPAMLLGSVSLPPVEVAQAYQTIAAGGFRAPLRAIREVLDASGRPLNRYPLAVESVVSAEAAYLTQWAMRRVVTQGTATWLKRRLPSDLAVAGKTGTTNDMRDSWFAGFSGDKVAVAWVGRDDNEPMGLSGSTGALRVWGDIMASVDTQPLDDAPPEGVVTAGACGSSLPYIDGYAGSACGGGGARTASRGSTPKASSSAEPVVAQEPAPRAPETKRRPEPKDEPRKREVSPFLSDFYGN
ncbi:penicillin-binding protein 1B [Thiohalocapsa halophila]|uniref:Penicillin-binding protein 1B n=1 Tax=Thiohalocapsa halophila TaxID=69359 RepID=A0ABS1CE70_9GAMM|nr:penicillin-binding protein 1B [Thiohalocapsa halophila]MBK1630013.1 penicillin-binding protein 1B [Thiohalocapsa halophila]